MSRVYFNGLSPLARGTLVGNRRRGGAVRFIPAGAGNTPARKSKRPESSVYPRWRGEHTSPEIKNVLNRRFIPAGAGNTSSVVHAIPRHTVYPR
ncbi:hypothetical protein SEEERB17_012015, partial [Salmonella enterica subsp. enterica serovar Enteritidis str. SARB17]